MATTTESRVRPWTADPDLLRCVHCHGPLRESAQGLACAACSAEFPVRDGILVVRDRGTDDNQIAADYYNGALWPKFRHWERLFWLCNGGERKSRAAILRHLPDEGGLRLLDVAIGDGVYTNWLPSDWSIVGLDVSTAQLANCGTRNANRDDLRLILGEAESMPFHDHKFDAVLSIGGFNHFNDPEGALREMVRVAKPGARIVVSDELPDLTDRMIGHRIGWPGIDRWVVSKVFKLGDEFTDLIERHRKMDVAGIGRRVLSNSRYELIWRGGGYVMVGNAPS